MKVKEREALIVYEALNSCIPFSTSASSHSFSQPSLVFLILAQAVVSPCSVLLRSFSSELCKTFFSKYLDTTEKVKESRLTKSFDANHQMKGALGIEISYNKQETTFKFFF